MSSFPDKIKKFLCLSHLNCIPLRGSTSTHSRQGPSHGRFPNLQGKVCLSLFLNVLCSHPSKGLSSELLFSAYTLYFNLYSYLFLTNLPPLFLCISFPPYFCVPINSFFSPCFCSLDLCPPLLLYHQTTLHATSYLQFCKGLQHWFLCNTLQV